MSSSNSAASPPSYSFKAVSDDSAVELFLIDARMQLVARGRRELITEQPIGVYTLKLRAGPTSREEVILLDRNMTYPVEPLRFASAVPLNATSETHEYQQAAAKDLSRKVNVELGKGASIFVFARDWTPDNGKVRSGHHPAEGLTLCSEQGVKLVDFQTQSVTDMSGDPWAACRVSVNPGLYRLAVRVATGEYFEMTLTALPGYFLKVFLVQRDESASGRGRHPDLARASVLMSRHEEFDKDSEESRIAEMAKLALVDRRRVYGTEMNRFLTKKAENPMLGILGGHLLLLEKEIDTALLRTVVQNLRKILPTPHPDVEALALAAGMVTAHRFTMPPMLRASWQIVLNHSVHQPELVPIGSLAASLATLITQQDPWLIWCRPGAKRQIDQRQRGIANFIKEQLEPSLVQLMSKMILSKAPKRVPALDKLMGELNLPPSTVAHLVEKFLHHTKSAVPKTVSDEKAPVKRTVAGRAAVRKQTPPKRAK